MFSAESIQATEVEDGMLCAGNWYEERLADPVPVVVHSTDPKDDPAGPVCKGEPDTFRTQTVDYALAGNPYKAADTISSCVTTRQYMDAQLAQTVSPVHKPKIVNQHNLRDLFQTHRRTENPGNGFGALLPRSIDCSDLGMVTTSQV